jgi:hypothetical protein
VRWCVCGAFAPTSPPEWGIRRPEMLDPLVAGTGLTANYQDRQWRPVVRRSERLGRCRLGGCARAGATPCLSGSEHPLAIRMELPGPTSTRRWICRQTAESLAVWPGSDTVVNFFPFSRVRHLYLP